ncbi:MAG: glycosyltransferase family 2 protein [Deltaproteobacteria bacterium]|jgi:glycosyltransferase involved in cell wall biosynthesis|nr:glycosyltransferase family 2 protein [Deltaproteobacteria bacterium]
MAEVLVVIPVYNHGATLLQVAEGVLAIHPHLLVVDDGSDAAAAPVLEGLALRILRHDVNRGKGAAIMTAAAWARAEGYSHIVTIDADGQHEPADLLNFLEVIKSSPYAFIVGARDFQTAGEVPRLTRFGRRFSEFWMFIQTSVRISDVQSGYRAYPLPALAALKLRDSHYSFEVEVLVKAAWAGFQIAEIPVKVRYPKASERISHFKVFKDNFRMTALNTRLTIRALIPVPFRQLTWDKGDRISALRPLTSLRKLLEDRATAEHLALSTLVPIVACALPILGFQSFLILFLIALLKLNRLWALAVTHACFPPLMPAFCIEVGHYVNHGVWLTDISWQTLGREVFQRLWDWLIGAVIGGPALGLVLAALVYLTARLIGRSLRRRQGSYGASN